MYVLYNVTVRCVRITIVAEEEQQYVFHIAKACP